MPLDEKPPCPPHSPHVSLWSDGHLIVWRQQNEQALPRTESTFLPESRRWCLWRRLLYPLLELHLDARLPCLGFQVLRCSTEHAYLVVDSRESAVESFFQGFPELLLVGL